MDKSGLDDDDDDDDEFSDGGHYKSPGRYDDHHPPPNYLPDVSYDNGDPSSPPDREMAKPGGFPSSLDRMEMMKRRFFEHYLKMGGGSSGGGYPMEYPLRSFPPPPQPPPPPRARDFSTSTASSAAEAHEAYEARHGMKGDGLDVPDSPMTLSGSLPHYLRRPYSVMRSFMEQSGERQDLNVRMAMLAHRAAENLRSDDPASPKKEQNFSFPASKDPASSSSPAAATSGEQGGPFSSHRDTSTSMFSVKREPGQQESPEGSPVKNRDGMPPTSTASSSTSSPLTKIPIPPALPSHQVAPRGGFHGELPPLHEMMLAQGMVAPGSRLPMIPHLGPSGGPTESAPQGHLYFCHLCSYSGK